MVTIPLIQDSAQLATSVGRERFQTDAEAEGGAEARGIANVARGVSRLAAVAEDKEDEFAEAEATDQFNQYERDLLNRLTNTETGYLSTTRERAAIDQRPQVEADIDRMAAERANAIANPRARVMFEDVARRRVSAALGQIASHASTQNTAYLDRQLQIQQSQATEAAVAMAHDPVEVTNQFSTMNAALARRRQMFGWSDEEYASIEGAARSDFYSGVIVALAADDPERAQTLYESVAPELRAEDRVQLYNTMRAAVRASEDAVIDEAWTFVAAGRRVPPELWNRVPGRSRIDIQNEIERRNRGDDRTGNRAMISDLTIMAVAEPQRFLQTDLRAVRSELGESAYQSLSVAQARLRNGEERAGISREMAQGAMQLATRQLRAAGYDLSSDASEDDALAVSEFQADLIGRLDRFTEESGGRAPNAQEQYAIVQDLLATRVVNEGGWFGWGRREGRYTDFYVPMTEMGEDEIERTRAALIRAGIEPTRGNIERAFAEARFNAERRGK